MAPSRYTPERMLHRPPIRTVPLAGTVAGVVAASALIALIRSAVAAPNLADLYLLPVMFCAVTWGWWYALGTAVLAFLAYDFLFVEPIFTFTIRDPEEWLALVVFMAVAAVTSNLAARERARREEAHRQARAATFLYDVTRALGTDELEPALRSVGARIMGELGLDGVAITLSRHDGRSDERIVVGDADLALDPQTAGRIFAAAADGARAGRWVIVRDAGKKSVAPRPRRPRAPLANFPLRRGDRQWGMLHLVGRSGGFADDETRVLATVADRLALGVERETLRDEANQAEILRRTDELRTALLNSVSHDLRTPMAAIKASAESLLQKDVA